GRRGRGGSGGLLRRGEHVLLADAATDAAARHRAEVHPALGGQPPDERGDVGARAVPVGCFLRGGGRCRRRLLLLRRLLLRRLLLRGLLLRGLLLRGLLLRGLLLGGLLLGGLLLGGLLLGGGRAAPGRPDDGELGAD